MDLLRRSLKIEPSSVALNLFRAHGLTQIQLATYIAEWALIMGQASGRVNLAGDALLFRVAMSISAGKLFRIRMSHRHEEGAREGLIGFAARPEQRLVLTPAGCL